MGALFIKVRDYLNGGQNILLFIAVALFLLALFVLYEALGFMRKHYA